MKKKYQITPFKWLLLAWLGLLQFAQAQDTNPTNGVEDRREKYFALTNAVIFTDYQTKVEGATLIIKNGAVEAVGKGLPIPKGATEINLQGKFIYPSLIDMYANYGMPEVKRPQGGGFFGRDQQESDKKGAYAWNQAIKTEINAEEVFTVNDAAAKDLRNLGFGTVLSHHPDGLIRGTGAIITLHTGRAQEVIVNGRASMHFSLDKGTSTQGFPVSPMGFFSLIRQTYYDADWYAKTGDKKEYNLSLEAFNKGKSLPAIFESRNKLYTLRIDKIGEEFGVQYIIKGTGDEYQRVNEIKATNAPLIIPVNYPEAYDVADPLDATLISLDEMKHWELAPTNAGALAKAGIPFAFTTQGLKNKSDFLKNIQKAIEYGLSETDALKALTHTPAMLLKAENKVGSLKKGSLANFIITSGNLFDKEGVIYDNWIQGNRYQVNPMIINDLRGVYDFSFGNQSGFKLTINGKMEAPTYTLEKASDSLKTNPKVSRQDNLLTISFKNAKKGKEAETGETRLSGWQSGKNLKGSGEMPDGQAVTWQAVYQSAPPADTTKPKKPETPKLSLGKVTYPFIAYGNEELPKAESILFKNATVWTNEKDGVLKETDVLVQNGKITQIGKNLNAQGAKVLDATNKHLTSGIIDEHSHIALFSINDIQTNSGEVRMADVVDADDIDMYRQLSGGVIGAQLLHGSANAIGGQSALIKFKWGEAPDKLLIPNAPGFIKFALGENVKGGNNPNPSSRFPQTRMGVEQVYEDAFTRAQEYIKMKKTPNMLFRKDLELETMAEILEKKRFITCHSYVQSEINMLMKVAEKYNFRVNTFTHILEGYKVADKMAKHGVGASSFSDWWAYKMEVKDAIPQSPALMTNLGVVTAINSDDNEMARRLNQEAAKSVKYAGMSEEDAWKMVTLNPAKLLHLDDRTGSVKVGKDADLVLWTDNPLSIYAVVEKTMVDGTVYFDREQDTQKQMAVQKERLRLIQKMIEAKSGGAPAQRPSFRRQRHFHCEDLDE
jgi:imidazolonepropionase-like amidohydrolase